MAQAAPAQKINQAIDRANADNRFYIDDITADYYGNMPHAHIDLPTLDDTLAALLDIQPTLTVGTIRTHDKTGDGSIFINVYFVAGQQDATMTIWLRPIPAPISGGSHDDPQPTPEDHNAVHVLFEPGCNECELRLCRSVINEYQPVSEYMSARDFAEYMQKWRDRMNRAIDRQRAEQSPLTYAEWVNLWSAARTNPHNTPEALDAVYKMHPGYQSLIQENANR